MDAYRVMPYESALYPLTHPDVLATTAALVGLRPAHPARCRLLDVGCADATNLLAMAAYLPGGDFVGIDAAENQIATGEALRREAGLDNVRLLSADLTDLPDLGTFDYIVVHGVYSWVPEPVRRALLGLCRRLLRPHGVAYVSYNVLPGWHTHRIVRDLMRFHTSGISDPAQKLAQARAIVRFAAQATGDSLYTEHAAFLDQQPDDYVYHDHLAGVNRAFSLHDFIQRAEAAGLQYVGDAELHRSLGLNLPDQTRVMLHHLTDDPVAAEQYLDFLTDRSLRRSLLCRREVSLTRELDPAVLRTLRVALPLTETRTLPDGRVAYFRPSAPEDMVLAQTPEQHALLERLRAAWPRAVPMASLTEAGRELMVACALRGFAALRTWEVPVVTTLSERPVVAPLVRALARRGQPLAGALLHSVAADDAALIGRLDGSHAPTRQERAALRGAAAAGLLVG